MSSLISIETDGESHRVQAKLWRDWHVQRKRTARDGLVEHYLPYARMMAASLYANRHSDEFEFDDYLQYATVGLLEAIDRYQPDSEAQFKTYASKRIKGAVLDGIEHMSERQVQISVKRRLRNERAESMAHALGDSPRGDSIFEKLAEIAIGLALGHMLEESMLYLGSEPQVADNQYYRVELRQMRKKIQALVEQLPEKERLVIKYHYFNHTPFETVAMQWNVTRGRIAQIHRSALLRLRELALTVGRHDVAW